MKKRERFYYCGYCGLNRDNDKLKPCKKCGHWQINEGLRELPERDFMFFCQKCNEPKNDKTTTTCCVECGTPLIRQ